MVTRPAPARRAARAARMAAPVIAGPPSTVTCPRLCLWLCAPGAGSGAHSVGVLAKVPPWASPRMARGSPMSAQTTSPHRERPGSSRWPGFRAAKVTVRSARRAKPRTSPLAPQRPEGTSTAMSFPRAGTASRNPRAALPRSRRRPAPNSASRTTAASPTSRAIGPRQRAAIAAASPAGGASATTDTPQPARSRCRAAT